jgi:hypothetical protein
MSRSNGMILQRGAQRKRYECVGWGSSSASAGRLRRSHIEQAPELGIDQVLACVIHIAQVRQVQAGAAAFYRLIPACHAHSHFVSRHDRPQIS